MELLKYNKCFKNEIINYVLSEEQLRYTGTPEKYINLSNEDSSMHSILATENNALVTFFVLHENEEAKSYSGNPNSILLRAFSTDYRYQGKGYAKESLKQLPTFVRQQFPHINEIVLAVNVKNIAAQKLYKKYGFFDKGLREMGKKGELIIMSHYL